MDVGGWLRGLGLGQYERAFRDNDIDGEVLPELTADDLIGLGVASIGHRRKLLAAVAALRQAAPHPETRPVRAEPAPPAIVPRPPAAERRQLTVMFVDLVGSTALATRLDPEDLRELIGAYHGCAAAAVGRAGGFVAKYMGDGVLAYFGWPEAHEDDAERAIRAGLELVVAVRGLEAPDGTRLGVRVGIATGLVVVGDLLGSGASREEAVVGETPNLAARLQALAEPDSVVIAANTRHLVSDMFECADLGTVEAKGFAGPVRAYRVMGAGAVESRSEALHLAGALTPLVGREQELGLLLRCWEQAKNGKGRVVLLSGEAGVGKSRLLAALRERLAEEPHIALRYFCSPHHRDSPLHPVIAQLERTAGFGRGDPPEARLAKLEALLAQASPPVEDVALLAELLSLPPGGPYAAPPLSPERKRERTFAALLRQLTGLAGRGPVLMVFEDVHWIDPSTRELLDLAVERATRLPVLVLVTFRPEFEPPWTSPAHVTALGLGRLGQREGDALVRRVAGHTALPEAVVAEIVERTDGVPLFAEELTKAVLEAGADRAAGALAAAAPAALAIPATLHASLLARLDRLGPAAREVAQVGAVIGREFSHELLAMVAARSDDELRDVLAQLAGTGMVFARGEPPDAVYSFKHALVQDAAYATLLRARRAEIHGRIASALGEHRPDLVERQPEVVAHHLTEAGRSKDAIGCWLKAGQLAAARSANLEAVSHLTNGLGLLPRLPGGTERDRMELEFQTVLGPALNAARGYAATETVAAFERAHELAQETGDGSRQDATLTGLFVAYFNRAEFRKAHRVATEFLDAARRQDDTAPRCIGHRMVAASLNTMGDFRPALPHAEEAVALYDRERHGPLAWRYVHDLGVAALNHLGISLWHAGRIDRSVRCEREALALAERLQHPNSTGYALWYCGALSAFRRRDFRGLQHLAEGLRAYARDHGLPHWTQFAMCLEGAALAATGRADQGIILIQEGIRTCEATRSQAFRPAFLAGLAEAQLRAGRWGQAEQTIETALHGSEHTGERWMDAELWRLRGQVATLSRRHTPERAEALFRRAAGCAERQGSRPLHLRALTSLARLWGGQRRSGEARDLLAPLHGCFTEGFDAPDLRDATALLHELA